MPVSPTYPGVYLEELPSSVRTITGVPTSITAFVGAAPRGRTDRPVTVSSLAGYEREFGGLHAGSALSYAVYQYYQNGGGAAVVVRVVGAGAEAATLSLGAGGPQLPAISEGDWGDQLVARVDHDTEPADANHYNLTIRDNATGVEEAYRNVSIVAADPRALGTQLARSRLVDAGTVTAADVRPAETADPAAGTRWYDDPAARYGATGGEDGAAPDAAAYNGSASAKTGMHQLLKTDLFNLLCLPGAPAGALDTAAGLCLDRRAVLLLDPPDAWTSVEAARDAMAAGPPITGDAAKNVAAYFPRVLLPDPLQDGAVRDFPPCGVVAGVISRTDAQRGVWKAPAGTDASLAAVRGLDVPLTDQENGELNPLGLNCLRMFPVIGPVVWGARTLRGADRLADQWKYLPVRRLALNLEEALYRGTQWVVFEPNDEPLWASVRLNVGAYMNGLFRQGAFQGRTPADAYLVKCDAENNPQEDIDRGILNILVGFAPLKPAEFVLIHIQQLAGQSGA